MFTGIIEAVGVLVSAEEHGGDVRIHIGGGALPMSRVQLGESVSTNGVCLTVTALVQNGFTADVSQETLSRTTLGALRPGSRVNLETALTLNKPLGGHMVTGHVDGVGRVLDRKSVGRSLQFDLEAPAGLAKYIAEKGSVCLDGVSLTVNQVAGKAFSVNVVPHTLEETVIGEYRPGTRVNIEVDLLARYLERLLLGEGAAVKTSDRGVTLELLARRGFLRD